tara:strand:+ start:10416 stop:11753 length:1338 start_codon:yes stop_codon:yes gene_type:complete
MKKILILDDEVSIVKTLSLHMKNEGYKVYEETKFDSAIHQIEKECPDIVITDLRVGDVSGIEVLKKIKSMGLPVECIIITAYGTIENAVESMRLGAFDYLTKPINSNELKIRVKKALDKLDLQAELTDLKRKLDIRTKSDTIVAESDSMRKIVTLIEHISDKDVSVLITGETGTGKEVLAKLIHETSNRSNKPFIAINCGALPEDLLDSELFGHVKGAFTGATKDSEGLLARANHGTVFLDEIGDITPRLQLRLLRLLQEGEIRAVGDTDTQILDVRVIAATNKDLKALITENEFREDLYFRLSVLPIHIPPLRERVADIPPLIEHFTARFVEKYNLKSLTIDQLAMEKLIMYQWPGNVRQLENTLMRAIALLENDRIDDKSIVFDEINSETSNATDNHAKIETLDAYIKQYMEKVVGVCSGNQTAAAKKLGISRSRLRRILEID